MLLFHQKEAKSLKAYCEAIREKKKKYKAGEGSLKGNKENER